MISGGGEGQVRIWNVTRSGHTSMREALKEHKGAITCIKITPSDEEVSRLSTMYNGTSDKGPSVHRTTKNWFILV